MLILLVETKLPELQTTLHINAPFGTFDPPIATVPYHWDVILSEDSSGGGYDEAWNRETWDRGRFVCS
jgi:hypothetical protein